MPKIFQLRVGVLLFVLIIILASGFRMIDLGWRPMTDYEAQLSLSASAAASQPSPFWQEGEPTIPTTPMHYALTSLIFSFIGADEVGARIIPALFGIGMIFLVFHLPSKQTGLELLVALILSVSTVLVTISRTSDGVIFSGFALFLIGLILIAKSGEIPTRSALIWIAIGIGIGLASGPSFYTGLLVLLVLVGISLLVKERVRALIGVDLTHFQWSELNRGDWLKAIGIAALLCVSLATGLGMKPGGLAGIPEAFGSWIMGWREAGDIKALTIFFMLPIYEPLLVLWAFIGSISYIRKRDLFGILISLWALIALIVIMAYPGRRSEDLIWVVLPLCILAANGLLRLINRVLQVRNWLVFLGFTTALLVLLVFGYLQLAAYAQNPEGVLGGIDPGIGYLGLAIIALALCVVVGLMIGLGWSWDMARASMGSAFSLLLLAFSISTLWNLNFRLSAAGAKELWREQASTIGLPVFIDTLENISQSQTGFIDSIPIQMYDEATASLAWGLRDFSEVRSNVVDAPPIVLARQEEQAPTLSADYIGQSCKIAEYKGWMSILPPKFMEWLIRRDAPTIPEVWLLLLRQDLSGSEGVQDLGTLDYE